MMKLLRKCTLCLIALSILSMTSCNESNKSESKDSSISDGSAETTQKSHAILNGMPATDSLYNGVVSLYMDDYSLCTGTLIHPQWVLTASHCVADDHKDSSPSMNRYASSLTIAIGNNPDELKKHQYDIESIYFHENYGKNANGDISNDIALIKLAKPIPETLAYPLPVLTPDNGITREKIQNDGVPITFVGFGYDENGHSDVKLYAKSHLVSYCGAANNDNINGCYYGIVSITGCHPANSYCMNHYLMNVTLPFGVLYWEQGEGGACNGDSGGPAFIELDDYPQIAVAGITSYGDSACSKVGVHTAVQDFYDSFIMKYAPEVATYHENRELELKRETEAGECGKEIMKICSMEAANDENFTGTFSCKVTDDNDIECGLGCAKDDENCIEGCTDGMQKCESENELSTCVNGTWERNTCPDSAPYCRRNMCKSTEVDWCTFHWFEPNVTNGTAIGYGRILIPSGNPDDIKNAYMACTSDLDKPVSEWTRTDAQLNTQCSNCGQNFEYMTSTYRLSFINHCTFVFEYNNETIACQPKQDGESDPILLTDDKKLEYQDIRFFLDD